MRCRAFFISRLKRSQAWFKQESKQRQETSSDFVVSFGSLEQKLEFERDGLCLSGRFFLVVLLGFSPLLPTPGFSRCVAYWGGPFLRACFFLRFEDQKRAPSLSYCFASISIGLRPSRPASKPASKLALRCFVLISMVSRHWSSRLALRPAFNFVSSYKLLVSLQFPST